MLPPADNEPWSFGPYEVQRLVGQGAMGVVYEAWEHALSRTVALKLLSPSVLSEPTSRERFARESRLAASIDHPHIVAVYSVGEHRGHSYIAMQWVPGGDLSQRLAADGPLPPADALLLLTQIADAVQTANDRGLLHRDIKPANVLLRSGTRTPFGLLADFGVASQESDLSLTATGGTIGTPLYTAPEISSGHSQATPASEVYSLGCLLFQTLTASAPFQRADAESMRIAHSEAPRPSVREFGIDVPEQVDSVIAKAMAIDPAARFASAGELMDAVERIQLLPAPLSATVVTPTAPPLPIPPETPPAKDAAGRRGPPPKALLVGGALSVVAAASIAVAAMTNDDNGPDPKNTNAAGLAATRVEAAVILLDRFRQARAAQRPEDLGRLLSEDVRWNSPLAGEDCRSLVGAESVTRAAKKSGMGPKDYRLAGVRRSAIVKTRAGVLATKGITEHSGASKGSPISFSFIMSGDQMKITAVNGDCGT